MQQSPDSQRPRSRAMLLTGEGVGALATVRLTGPRSRPFLEKHFHGRTGAAVEGMHYGKLLDGEQVLDDPVVCLAGNVADIHLHGGRWIVQRTLQLATEAGFEVIRPLPLPLPAEAVDADSQLEAEVLQWLPLAKTREAAASLLAQPRLWRELTANADETAVQKAISRQGLAWLLHPPQVAIAGVANAGKSTLANTLLGRERIIAADAAGTTRDWVEEEANIEGLAVRLVDTPGLRQAAEEIEREAIRLAQPVLAAADLVVVLLDPTQPMGPQMAIQQQYPAALLLAGKNDEPSLWRPPPEALRFSALTGEGLPQLRRVLRERFDCATLPLEVPAVWTSRQRQILTSSAPFAFRIAMLIGDIKCEQTGG